MLASLIICFIAAIACPFFVRPRFKYIGWILAIIPLWLTCYFAHLIPMIVHGNAAQSSIAWLPDLGINLAFRVDGLSNLFALLISAIGTLVVLYSGSYLKGHPQLGRFYAYLFFFMGAMLGIVLADNLIILFICWEFTTLSSFLLISFDHENLASRKAALQGLIITASGGLAMLAGFVLIKLASGNFSIHQLLNQPLQHSPYYIAIVILVLLGAFTKSAQFPFHFWLPNAMQAPTPVSAYLHSATMVQAGVYLVARLTPALGHSSLWFFLLTLFGAVTMITSSILAIRATDIKRMLAYSTTMALGLLMFLLASGKDMMVNGAMLFFFAHALYKAGLFLSAGNIDHTAGTRDIRKLHGLKTSMPITFIAVILCAASMAGLPPLIGFVSKELIYEAKLNMEGLAAVLIAIAIITNIIFALISGLIAFKPFLKKSHAQQQQHDNEIKHAPALWLPPLLLGIFSLLFGLLPYAVDGSIVFPAASAIHRMSIEMRLKLWHGLSPAFMLSLFTLICAAVLYFLYPKLFKLINSWRFIKKFSPEKIFELKLKLIKKFSCQLTHIIQSGQMSYYLTTTFVTVLLLVGGTYLVSNNFHHMQIFPFHAYWFDWMMVLLIFIAAIAIITGLPHLASIVCLSVVGIGTTLIYLVYGAPDVAITQVLVDILTIVIVVLALYRLPSLPQRKRMTKKRSTLNAIIAILFGLLVTLLLLSMLNMPFNRFVTTFYEHNSLSMAHGHNIVNVILVDFRAFDTFGETLVVALAGLGVLGLLKLTTEGKNK